jgi:molybdenum cofactor cytidylyltransferase
MIPGVVLAAGESSRMGRPKALLAAASHGESFLDRMTRILHEGGVEEIIVVIGREADVIRRELPAIPRQLRVVHNPHYAQGQLSSLLAGLDAADKPGVRAVLVTPVDLPLLSSGTVRAVLDAYRDSKGKALVVRPEMRGRHGHPVVFDRALFGELRRADPQAGARIVVHAHSADVLNVHVDDEGAFIDIDTPDDYNRYVQAPGSRL